MKKYIKYLFLLIWTLVFIINVFIKGNYKNYSILSYIIIATIFSIPFVILKLKSKKQKNKHTECASNNIEYAPKMQKTNSARAYYKAALSNEYRIITESINIIKNTKNIETLCKRYELALEHAIKIKDQRYVEDLETNCIKYISDCYHRYIGSVKTEKAKQNRKVKFFETLNNYLDKK